MAHGGLGVCVYTHRAPRVMSLRNVVDVFYLAAAASAGTRIVAAASRQLRQAYYEDSEGVHTRPEYVQYCS